MVSWIHRSVYFWMDGWMIDGSKVWCSLNKIHSCLPPPPQPYSRSSRASGWGCDSEGASGIFSAVPSHALSVQLARPELLSHHPEASGVWQTSVRGGSSTGTGWPLPHLIIYAVLFPYQRLQCCSLWYWQLFYGQSLNHAGWREHVSHDPPGTLCAVVCVKVCLQKHENECNKWSLLTMCPICLCTCLLSGETNVLFFFFK